MLDLDKIEGISDSLKQYLQLNYEIVKLEVVKKTSEISGALFGSLVVGIVLFFFVLILSMGVGFYLSELIGDAYSGFGIVALFYLLISIILLIGRKKLIEKPLRNKIIKELLGNRED